MTGSFPCCLTSFRLFAVDHPDTASYPEDFVSDARAVVSRVQVSWKDITIERIKRVLDRISRSKFPLAITCFLPTHASSEIYLNQVADLFQGIGGLIYYL